MMDRFVLLQCRLSQVCANFELESIVDLNRFTRDLEDEKKSATDFLTLFLGPFAWQIVVPHD